MRLLVELVAPLRCVACGALCDGELCAACASDVTVLKAPWCDRCGTPGPSEAGRCCTCASLGGFDRARSVVAFADPARRLTLALKRRGRRGLAEDIGALIAAAGAREGLASDAAAVTWVPGGRSSRRAGFDHTALLARAVGRALGLPAMRLLDRALDGPRQADVPLSTRRSNVRGRFVSRGACGRVLLVDDVLTTGATAEACAQALRSAGASAVDVLTWARTLRWRA